MLKVRCLKEFVFLVYARARYMGLAKTRLQHIVTAAAMNLSRMWAFWRNIPIGLTRASGFSALFTPA
ncbi:transposase [Microcoleus sp. herbarium12]|uniref:transposase n=1 Tax=Microcoleus sp. herbarium12 TaxID=3055437 RepID=UPI003FA595CE